MNHKTTELSQVTENLLQLLDNSYETSSELIKKFKNLVENQPEDFYGKKSNVAHITASGLVVDETGTQVLLTHHGKLNMWLQLGGHWMDSGDGVETVLNAAVREVFEEGYGNRVVPMKLLNDGNIMDLDVHSVGSHSHYDICFLMQIDKSIPITITPESHDLQWVKMEDILKNSEQYDERLIRMVKKTHVLANVPQNNDLSRMKP